VATAVSTIGKVSFTLYQTHVATKPEVVQDHVIAHASTVKG
jgi:hypothetical protein